MPPSQPDIFKHPGKPKAGKSSAAGVVTDPQQQLAVASAAPAVDEVATLSRPRPATTRYPISLQDFEDLEAKAAKVKAKAKKGTTFVADKPDKRELAQQPGVPLASGPAASAPQAGPPAPPAGLPAGPPAPMGNFAGLPDTGWFPPDCTIAAGPNHIVVSGNASFIVYTKAGVVARPAQTFAIWYANVITAAKIFDPKVIFDKQSNRWFLLTVAKPSDQT